MTALVEMGDRAAVEQLNRECFCITLDRASLHDALRRETNDPAFVATYIASRPHLFSNAPVFLSRGEITAMAEIVEAIEAAARLPGYQAAALAGAPEIALRDFGPVGAFMGYDFHLGAQGPKLIEVNTNAGGAFLNAFVGKAQHVCCAEVGVAMGGSLAEDFDAAAWRMFETEWTRQGRTGRPHLAAIVDDEPEAQYLFPEFVLAQRFFERNGVRAVIADPRELRFSDGQLLFQGEPVDLVYNRLVDFALSNPEHDELRRAYLADAVVVTPNPRNHALLADKRNLTRLSEPARLEAWGLSPRHRRALAGVPRSTIVTRENADRLWAERKRLFFKPAGGHGGKAVYRGDKVTKGVWANIVDGAYIAQAFAAPSERMIDHDGEVRPHKLDVRLYTYEGTPLLAVARVYQGQTTNFRTPGGGFAPVFVI
ncbi:MAG: hypothetical protein Q8Q88_21535 [Phenylobacterium sp.]|uniref:hypothetical protein n=1 Tax=Phenylobacterium sp. TaxID=1871053 RepID=UPI00273656BE|nr:hypothetical protein [Phenylobacterium sp.]MDP3749622.1 hypothetical protein [Phenylobacterium sp.]